MRAPRYQLIADELRARVDEGRYTAGRLLPSEATLRAEFGVSRATLRRALEQLRAEGLIDARQGLGWFVAAEPVRQPLSHLDTIEARLAASGVVPEREVLGFAFVEAAERIAAVLGCTTVLEVTRRNLADGQPFARVTVWCPAELAGSLSRDDVTRASFHDLLPVTLGGAEQTIGAQAASAADATLLEIPLGSPVLVVERVTRDADGRPVLVSEHVFPGHRTVFAAELPRPGQAPDASGLPSGVRLVGGEASRGG